LFVVCPFWLSAKPDLVWLSRFAIFGASTSRISSGLGAHIIGRPCAFVRPSETANFGNARCTFVRCQTGWSVVPGQQRANRSPIFSARLASAARHSAPTDLVYRGDWEYGQGVSPRAQSRPAKPICSARMDDVGQLGSTSAPNPTQTLLFRWQQ